MESEYLYAGDIVMLRSGGPWMTVEDTEDGEAHCSYFVEGHLEHGTFREEALLKLFEAELEEEPTEESDEESAEQPVHDATDD